MVGNSLGSVLRAILIGALSEDGTDIWESFYSPVDFTGKVILDPFMGAGTTLGEALKLGCRVVGCDINPVSTFQVQKALEPVDVSELRKAFEHVKGKVQGQIQSIYQTFDYNYREWRQLFNERQYNCLSLLLQAILEEPDRACRELLLLLFSSTLEYNNMFCSYKGEGTGAVRPIFNHHILKPERMALENSVWGTKKSSGCFSTLFESKLMRGLTYQQEPFELCAIQDGTKLRGEKMYKLSHMPITSLATDFDTLNDKDSRALLFCQDSSHLALPEQSVDLVVTDPPYFDFVHYSELADFFYSWLCVGLREERAEFSVRTTRHPAEVQQRDAQAFSMALSRVLQECSRVLKPDGLLIFSFHHSRNEGWEAVGQAIFNAHLNVVAAYPIKAEMSAATPKAQTKEPINYDAILVCKKCATRITSTTTSLEDAIYATVVKVREKFHSLSNNSSSSRFSYGDRFVIMQSQALCVFSQHFDSIVDISGKKVSLSRFLTATSYHWKKFSLLMKSY